MKMLTIPVLTLALLAAAASAAGTEEAAARFDHYDPVSLNEMAMKKVRTGDTATAMILLERAVLLAPHEPLIRQNLETLKTWREGKLSPTRAADAPAATTPSPVTPASAPAPAKSAGPVEADPLAFPLWRKR